MRPQPVFLSWLVSEEFVSVGGDTRAVFIIKYYGKLIMFLILVFGVSMELVRRLVVTVCVKSKKAVMNRYLTATSVCVATPQAPSPLM